MKACVEGVYFLYSSDELVYVGQSSDIWGRISEHLHEGTKEFDSFDYYETKNRMELESILIKILHPKYNKTDNPEYLEYKLGKKKDDEDKKDQFYNLGIGEIIDAYEENKRQVPVKDLAENLHMPNRQLLKILFKHKNEVPMWQIKEQWYIDYVWYIENFQLVNQWLNENKQECVGIEYGTPESRIAFPVMDFIPEGWSILEDAPQAPRGYSWYSNSSNQWEILFQCALVKNDTETVEIRDEDNNEIKAISKRALLNSDLDCVPDGWTLYYSRLTADGIRYKYCTNGKWPTDEDYKYCLVKEKDNGENK